MKDIYLDAAAGMPMHPTITDTYISLAAELTNPHTFMSKTSRKSADLLKEAEERVCYCIGANPKTSTILWTGSGSQANTLAQKLLLGFSPFPVHSGVEHKSLTFNTAPGLKPSLEGEFNSKWPSQLNHVGAATHMLINNETGTYFNNRIVSLVNKFKHSDCCQALGKVEIDVDHLGLDAVTLSSHKIGGPSGLGCLWVRSKQHAARLPYQGTPDVAACYCFAERAMDVCNNDHSYKEQAWLFSELLDEQNVEHTMWTHYVDTHTGILSIKFDGYEDAVMLCMEAADKGVILSTGAACNADASTVPSETLIKFGLTPEDALATVRVSFHEDLTEEDITYAAYVIGDIVNKYKGG